jgi:hypothetical protein
MGEWPLCFNFMVKDEETYFPKELLVSVSRQKRNIF